MSSLRKTSTSSSEDEAEQLRRGPWTLEEDSLLIHYIARHGEGRWNLLAKHAGLRRTGKSCRLRWLNYLKPDVKRGNLSPQEQFLILELHSKWGNRWSRIAHLPGRTDNEIKNYWRTRVQRQARHLKIDVNSVAFQNMIRCCWMPSLLQKMESQAPNGTSQHQALMRPGEQNSNSNSDSEQCGNACVSFIESIENMSKVSDLAGYQTNPSSAFGHNTLASKDCYSYDYTSFYDMETIGLAATSALSEGFPNPVGDCHLADNNWVNDGFVDHGLWSMGEPWELRSFH